MAYPTTHIIVALITLSALRKWVFKDKFPRYLVLIGAASSMIPDFDIPFTWVYSHFAKVSIKLHGLASHSVTLSLSIAVLAVLCFLLKKQVAGYLLLMVAAGTATHLFLDCMYGGYGSLLWPLTINTYAYCPAFVRSIDNLYWLVGDAILLVGWLTYMEVTNKIKSYI